MSTQIHQKVVDVHLNTVDKVSSSVLTSIFRKNPSRPETRRKPTRVTPVKDRVEGVTEDKDFRRETEEGLRGKEGVEEDRVFTFCYTYIKGW